MWIHLRPQSRDFQLGYAAAAAEVLFLLIVLLTLTQYALTMRGGEGERGR